MGLASDALSGFPTEEALGLIRSNFPNEERLFVYEVVESRNGDRFIGLVRPLGGAPEQHHPPEDEVTATYGAELHAHHSADTKPETSSRALWEAVADVHPALVDDLFEAAKAKQASVVPEGYSVYDYTPPTANTGFASWRFVLNLVNRDSRKFMVGAGFRCVSAHPSSVLIVVGAYVAIWAGLTFLFLREGAHVLIAAAIGVFVAAVLYFQYAEPMNRRQEIEFSSALRSTSIAIAAASLGVSIFLRKTHTKTVLMLVLVGFFLAIVPLALSGAVFGSGALEKVNSAIVVMLALSASCILAVLVIALPGVESVSA